MRMLAAPMASLALLPVWITLSIASMLAAPGLTSSAHAAGLEPAHVPADAKWVVHVDYEALSQSQLFQKIRQDSPMISKAVQGWMTSRYGINPPQDLKSATLFSRDYRRYTGTVLLQADFDRDKIEAVLRKQQNYRTTEQDGQTFHTVTLSQQKQQGPSGDQEMTVVMLDSDTLILASSVQTAQQTLDLLAGEAKTLADSKSPLLTENAGDAWIYGAAIDLGQLKDHPVSMPVLAQHQRITWSVGSQGEGKLYETAEFVARDEAVAKKMQQVLQGVLAYESLWAEGSEPMKTLIADAKITREGKTAGFSWQGDTQTVVAALDDVLVRVKTWAPLWNQHRGQGSPGR